MTHRTRTLHVTALCAPRWIVAAALGIGLVVAPGAGGWCAEKPADARKGPERHADWPGDPLDWKASPVDLSFLNAHERPAGRHGFLRVVGGTLAFEDGTPVRFWGTNITSYALFGTTPENTKLQARRIAALGFNLVRLHHHDSEWVVPNIFGGKGVRDTRTLDPVMLDKLDWWIACLKEEGVYVWLDLQVGRRVTAADGIEGFDEMRGSERTAGMHGYSYVNASLQRAMRRFNESYVDHRNAYTGLPYKDDPAIVAMLLTNENDLTGHYGNALLPARKVPWHTAAYLRAAAEFAAKYGLPKAKVWRSWEPGSAKLFLNDLEYRVNASFIEHLRSIGVSVPIASTSTWGNPLFSLPALTVGDLVDVHAYGAADELGRNPLHEANFLHWIAAAQVAGRPLSVSEWNVEGFPVADRHVTPLYVAANARLQGWAALMQFAYAKDAPNGPGVPSNWHAFNDPALIATLPAAALLFRRGDVRESETVYAFAPDPSQLFDQALSPANSVALRTAAERGKLLIVLPKAPSLPWLQASPVPSGALVFRDPARSFIAPDAAEVVSDTGELMRNWALGVFSINSPKVQAAAGRIGGRTIRLADVAISLVTQSATLAVQSMDESPIARSRKILISFAARSIPGAGGKVPFVSEPVEGKLLVHARPGLRLFRLGVSAKGQSALPMQRRDGRYVVRLGDAGGDHWLILR